MAEFDVKFSEDEALTASFSEITVITPDPYSGAYIVTPTKQTQTLLTNGKKMTDNVTINPIPSNYGLITYNGFQITVS